MNKSIETDLGNREIFAQNLKRYLRLSGKTQVEAAKAVKEIKSEKIKNKWAEVFWKLCEKKEKAHLKMTKSKRDISGLKACLFDPNDF